MAIGTKTSFNTILLDHTCLETIIVDYVRPTLFCKFIIFHRDNHLVKKKKSVIVFDYQTMKISIAVPSSCILMSVCLCER